MNPSLLSLLTASVLMVVSSSPVAGDELTMDRMVRRPVPGQTAPEQLAFSPDGDRVTFLKVRPGTKIQDLWQLDIASGEQSVLLSASAMDGGTREGEISREEELRRERQRELSEGITAYHWAERAPVMVVPLHGDVFIRSQRGLERLTQTEAPEIDPRLSADGTRVAYVRDGALFVSDIDFSNGPPVERKLSPNGKEGVFYGTAEFIAQEEFDREHGLWWSPDGAFLAYTEVDEREVTLLPIVHQAGEKWGAPEIEEHRYPFAGETNARVRVGVVDSAGGDTRWIPLEGLHDGYLLGVDWLPDSSGFFVRMLDRAQKTVRVRHVPVDSSKESVELFEEKSSTWIDAGHAPRFFTDAQSGLKGFAWVSMASDLPSVQIRDHGGALVRTLSDPSIHVDRVVAIDEGNGLLFFEGWRGDPRERHLFRVGLTKGTPERLTREAGMHRAVFDRSGHRYIHTFNSLQSPPTVGLREPGGALIATLHRPDLEEAERLGLGPPTPFEVLAEDGTVLHGHLFLPPEHRPGDKWPAILYVYGGPGVQIVQTAWHCTADLRSQWLARRGYVVARVDNRGTGRRGQAFASVHYRNLGTVEVADQVRVVRHLVKHVGVDPDRVGIMGWSYGGYLSLMALARAPDVIQVAFAGAPVTDWAGYDTGYTERYMSTPVDNPDGYGQGSVLTHVGAIRGSLFVVHGMIDENVHFRHTVKLVSALTSHQIPYELLVYPDARHSPRNEDDKRFAYERAFQFLDEHLNPGHGSGAALP